MKRISYFQSKLTNPIPLGDLIAWFDAEKGVNVDGSNNLTSWEDQSGNGRNTAYGAVPVPPVFVNNGIGGKPSLRWNGTQRAGANFTLPKSADYTFIIVANCTLKTPDRRGLLGFMDLVNGQSWFLGMGFGNYGGGYFAAGAGGVFQGTDLGDTNHITQGVPYTVVFSKDTNQWKYYTNGASIRTIPDADDIIASSVTIAIGNTDSHYYQSPFHGDISEIIIYGKVLSNSERQQVENYLRSKYAHY